MAHGRHKITQYVDCVTKELRNIPAFEITQNRTGQLYDSVTQLQKRKKTVTTLFAHDL